MDYDMLQCIDRGLEKFGHAVKQTIYWKISILYGSPQKEIVSNPAILVDVIRTTFRDSAVGVEKVLLSEIESCFGRFENCGTLEEILKAMSGHYAVESNSSQKMILSR